MSHTIGQAEPDNQQLNPNTLQDSQHPVTLTSSGDSSLKDGDYEFLYNQLLEGVAHGWHDRRIIKFFQSRIRASHAWTVQECQGAPFPKCCSGLAE